ncbi:MAG: COG1361 S-layer family protein [archaeon]
MKQIIILTAIFCLIISSAFAVTGKAVIINMLNQDPDPAISGDIVEIRISVENMGDKSTDDYFLEFVPEYPFEGVPGENYIAEIGTLSSNLVGANMKIVKFKVRVNKDVRAGTYNFPLMDYEQGKRDASAKRYFSVDVESTESAEIIYIDQVELIPGQITPLTFTINNVGSTPLRDLTFQWENEDDIVLPVGSDNTKYVKYIDVGESADLKFDVIASTIADPNLYKLDLTLSYTDSATNTVNEINTKAGVYVGGSTDFDVAYSGSASGEYSFSISNIGSVAATSVTVKVPEQQGWRVTGSNSVIIGNLNEGDYTIASFTMQQTTQMPSGTIPVNNTRFNQSQRVRSSGNQNMNIDIIYTDSRGNRKTVTKEVSIASSADPAATDATGTTAAGTANFNGAARFRQTRPSTLQVLLGYAPWMVLVIVVVGVGVLVRKKYKKGLLKDPDYTYKKAVKDIFRKKKNK